MEHPRSKLPAVLVVLFCIALLAGVGVLLWKTLPEKQEPAQAGGNPDRRRVFLRANDRRTGT